MLDPFQRGHSESFLARHAFELILAVVVLTRLPFLFTGYGSDPDAWLVASAASSLWHTGSYVESRLPGYPLHEILLAPAVGIGGSAFSNAATLMAALTAIAVWRHIVSRKANHPLILLLAFAFAPVFWQHSAVTLDYVWSLLFILLAFVITTNTKPVLAGVITGIAAGFRPPNLLMIIPLAALLLAERTDKKKIVTFIAAASVTTLVAFLPLIVKYGGVSGWLIQTELDMSDISFTGRDRLAAFFYRSVYFFGPVAFVLLLVGVVHGRKSLTNALHTRQPLMVVSVVAVVTFLSLFLWLPLERAYMLPALPFVLLIADALFSKKMLIFFTCSLVLHGLVNFDIVQRTGGEKMFGFNIHPGMVVEEIRDRDLLLREREYFSTYPYPDRSIIMTGGGAAFWFENDAVIPVTPSPDFAGIHSLKSSPHHRVAALRRNQSVVFLPHLTLDELQRLQRKGFTVFCTDRAKPHIESLVGYRMELYGVTAVRFKDEEKAM